MAPESSRPPEPADVTVRRGRGFWLAYAAGWILYSGLIVVAEAGERGDLVHALAVVAAVAGPGALFGAVVAARRTDFFRPDRTLWGMARLHVSTALVYSVVCSVVSRLLLRVLQPVVGGSATWLDYPALLQGATYLFLYVLLAGFLMWTESIARVQESRARAAREAMLRAQAEAKALRARFNPHFVFNVLHSLMLLVRAEPERAERAIEDVAALIRYASRLEREERDAVPLEDEMEFARRYLALEEMRLEGRLRVRWEVEEGLGRTPVPAFALQTLLENAVKHGLSASPSGGTVRVAAVRRDGELVLSVEDDGPGAAPEAVGDGEGRGLRLLRDRVRALFAEEGTLAWRTAPGEGFRAEIRLPAAGAA